MFFIAAFAFFAHYSYAYKVEIYIAKTNQEVFLKTIWFFNALEFGLENSPKSYLWRNFCSSF